VVDDQSSPDRSDTAFDPAVAWDNPVEGNGYSLDPVLGFSDGLLCFSHLRWDFVFQRPQHLMRRFATKLPVWFWEEPIPVWEKTRYGDVTEPTLLRHSTQEGVTVLRPLLPPDMDASTVLGIQAELLRGFINEQGINRPIFWFYTPFLRPITVGIQRVLTVYDCMDELSAFRFAPPDLVLQESRMLDAADLVFTGGLSLYEARRGRHAHLHSFPSGVDIEHFLPARTPLAEPADQAGIPHPRLGFFGVLDERLDQALLDAIAVLQPSWHFVMVGPVVKIDAAQLPRRPNIHYLGSKPYTDLPAYLAGWDVALMPFALNEATRYISPTKTPEYLAAGKPVVSTPIADVVSTYGECPAVRIAGSPVSFVEQAEDALCLAQRPGDWRPGVDAMLRGMTWDGTWQAMTEQMGMRNRQLHQKVGLTPNVVPLCNPTSGLDNVAWAQSGKQSQPLFSSMFLGGFEGSSQILPGGQRIDMISKSQHDRNAESDYRMLQSAGISGMRDALRWHLIETVPGRYDWSSFLPMLRAALRTNSTVVWDLCHYGLPVGLDIWSEVFVERFAAFAAAAAQVVAAETDSIPFYCPINEISYWAWAGGDHRRMYPGGKGRGNELKRQLVRATIAGIKAVRTVDPRARFVQAEPLINVVARSERRADHAAAAAHHAAQYEAFDMIAGRSAPELGGSEAFLDIVGCNYYSDNQWFTSGRTLPLGSLHFRPLHDLFREVHERYGRSILISETGAEGGNGPGWLRYVVGEVAEALRAGSPVEGICIYPIMDYPGWSNGRHCRCGLIRVGPDWNARTSDTAMLRQLIEEQHRLQDSAVMLPELLP